MRNVFKNSYNNSEGKISMIFLDELLKHSMLDFLKEFLVKFFKKSLAKFLKQFLKKISEWIIGRVFERIRTEIHEFLEELWEKYTKASIEKWLKDVYADFMKSTQNNSGRIFKRNRWRFFWKISKGIYEIILSRISGMLILHLPGEAFDKLL